jgi:hypothetical protein
LGLLSWISEQPEVAGKWIVLLKTVIGFRAATMKNYCLALDRLFQYVDTMYELKPSDPSNLKELLVAAHKKFTGVRKGM